MTTVPRCKRMHTSRGLIIGLLVCLTNTGTGNTVDSTNFTTVGGISPITSNTQNVTANTNAFDSKSMPNTSILLSTRASTGHQLYNSSNSAPSNDSSSPSISVPNLSTTNSTNESTMKSREQSTQSSSITPLFSSKTANSTTTGSIIYSQNINLTSTSLTSTTSTSSATLSTGQNTKLTSETLSLPLNGTQPTTDINANTKNINTSPRNSTTPRSSLRSSPTASQIPTRTQSANETQNTYEQYTNYSSIYSTSSLLTNSSKATPIANSTANASSTYGKINDTMRISSENPIKNSQNSKSGTLRITSQTATRKPMTKTTPSGSGTVSKRKEDNYDHELVIIFGVMLGLMFLAIFIFCVYRCYKKEQKETFKEGGGDISIKMSQF